MNRMLILMVVLMLVGCQSNLETELTPIPTLSKIIQSDDFKRLVKLEDQIQDMIFNQEVDFEAVSNLFAEPEANEPFTDVCSLSSDKLGTIRGAENYLEVICEKTALLKDIVDGYELTKYPELLKETIQSIQPSQDPVIRISQSQNEN